MPFIFTGLKFQDVCLKKCSSFWGTASPDTLPGLRSWTPLGGGGASVPRALICLQLHLLDPLLRESGAGKAAKDHLEVEMSRMQSSYKAIKSFRIMLSEVGTRVFTQNNSCVQIVDT